jgi:hypothetical protein
MGAPTAGAERNAGTGGNRLRGDRSSWSSAGNRVGRGRNVGRARGDAVRSFRVQPWIQGRACSPSASHLFTHSRSIAEGQQTGCCTSDGTQAAHTYAWLHRTAQAVGRARHHPGACRHRLCGAQEQFRSYRATRTGRGPSAAADRVTNQQNCVSTQRVDGANAPEDEEGQGGARCEAGSLASSASPASSATSSGTCAPASASSASATSASATSALASAG